MDLINDVTAADSYPALPVSFGTGPGWFSEGNPATGTPATDVRAWWLNMVQAEIHAAVLGGSITPDKTNNGQLLQSIRRLGASNASYLTAGGSLTLDQTGAVGVSGAAGGFALILPPANSMDGSPIRFDFMRLDASANVIAVEVSGADVFYPGDINRIGLSPLSRVSICSDGGDKWYIFFQSAEQGGFALIYGDVTFVPPLNVTTVDVDGVGGGGGGGGCNGTQAGGGGGSGGAFRGVCEVTPGVGIPVTIGAAGIAGTGAQSGTDGGTTSFGTFLSATGGKGGVWSNTAPIGGGPGLGDASGVGALGGGGLYGGFGSDASPGSNQFGGDGASSIYGGGVKASAFFGTSAVSAAPGSGGGGGQGAASISGTNGLPGVVAIRWRSA